MFTVGTRVSAALLRRGCGCSVTGVQPLRTVSASVSLERPSLSWKSFVEQVPQAESVCRQWQQEGALVRVPDSKEPLLAGTVLLGDAQGEKGVQWVSRVLAQVLDASKERATGRLHQLEEEVVQLGAQWREMDSRQRAMQAKAEGYAQRVLKSGLAFLIVQTAVLADLTFDIYAWDVTEPICFFAASTTIFSGFVYYMMTRRDHTFVDMHTSLFQRKMKQLTRKTGFDQDKYQALTQDIATKKSQIHDLRLRLGLDPSST